MTEKASAPRCLDADVATAYATGRLAPRELAAVEDHIDRCVTCRQLLSRTAEMMTPVPAAAGVDAGEGAAAAGDEPSPGTVAGRYVIDARVGAGGLGVVYAAHDPELGRKVALKVMRAETLPSSRLAEDLLRREAMAMARIAHPNVVGVHDLFVARGTLFVAMEFIEGLTLRAWLDQARRSWREVLGVLVLAGRGLAAAHAEGVVHRDLKPENILVGASGRVCVSDFGLSRLAARTATVERPYGGERQAAGASPVSTIAGGTPRYMSPEQVAGKSVTPLSDQFSFAVVLYEALYGEHPFGRAGRGERGDWHVRPPPETSAVPGWVQRCVLRGLREEPTDRYAGMTDLLSALGNDPGTRRRRIAMATAATAVLAMVAGAWVHARHVRREACAHAEAKFSGVWDEARRQSGARALEAVGTPFAKDEWGFIERPLDRYAGRWGQARTQACEDVLARGEPADVERDPRVVCLDDRLEEVRAVVDGVLAVSNDEQVGRAVTAAQSIRSVESCSRPPAERARGSESPARALAERPIRGDLARGAAWSYFARYDDAAALAESAAETAEHAGSDLLLGKALRRAAQSHMLSGHANWASVESQFYRAIVVADRCGDDATRAASWGGLLFLEGVYDGKLSRTEADRFFDQGMSAVLRLGGDDELEAELRSSFADALAQEGDCEASRAQSTLAIAASTRAGFSLLTGEIVGNLGKEDMRCGDLRSAGEHLSAAEAALRQAVGASHRSTLTVRNGEAFLHVQDMAFAAARDVARDLLEVYQADGRAERVEAAFVMETLAEALLGLGEYEEARRLALRSLSIRNSLKLAPSLLTAPLASLGRAHVELHEPAAALEPLERAVASDVGGAEDRADARFALARALTDLHRDPKRALLLATDAAEIFDKLPLRTPLQASKRDEVRAWLARAASPVAVSVSSLDRARP